MVVLNTVKGQRGIIRMMSLMRKTILMTVMKIKMTRKKTTSMRPTTSSNFLSFK